MRLKNSLLFMNYNLSIGNLVEAYLEENSIIVVYRGTLKYWGPVSFATGLWAGIKLFENGIGKMNGIVNGTKYFECHKNSGIMVKINCVMPLHFGELDRNKDIKNALPKTNFNLSNKSERQAKSALLVQLSRTLSHLRNRISALENHQSYAIVEFRKLNEKYESFLDPNQNGFSMDEIFDLKKSIDGFLKFVSMDSKKHSQFKWISENKTVQESTPRIQSLNTQCIIDSSNYTPRVSISDVGFCGFPKQGDDYLNPIAFELVSSEKTYLKDLILLNTIYVVPSKSVLSREQYKTLFSRLPPVMDVSRSLLDLLQTYELLNEQRIGEIFLSILPKLKQAYYYYCESYEESIKIMKLFASPKCCPSIKQFLCNSDAELRGKSTSWGLDSLMIKPVQRVLKYTILLQRILKTKDNYHPQSLRLAYQLMLKMNEQINHRQKRTFTCSTTPL